MSEATERAVEAQNGQPEGLMAKLAAIRDGIASVDQSGENKHLSYRYPTDSDMYNAVRPLLAQHGVLLTPSLANLDGNGQNATVVVRFTWLDVASGETLEGEWAGTGSDNLKSGGTAVYKAYTGAIRTYLAKFFQVPTGENPEEGHGESADVAEPSRTLTDDEAHRLNAVVEAAGLSDHLPTKLAGFGVKALTELTLEQAIAVHSWAQDADHD